MPLWKQLILGQKMCLHIEVGRNVCWKKSNTMLVGQTQYTAGQSGKKRRHCTTLITQVCLSSTVIQMQGNHLTRKVEQTQKCNKIHFCICPQVHWGYYQTLIWSQLAIGLLGDNVLMYQYSMYIFNIWNYGLLGFINVTERNHRMTLNTAFIHINTSKTAYITSQHKVDNQFISS